MKTKVLTNGESLAKALETVEPNTKIVLEPICYREKIIITTNNITLSGTLGKSSIVYGDYAKKIHEDGLEYVTFRTYTVNVLADNVIFENITIENDAYSPETKGQAVALSVYANNFKGENLILKSAQDTLFLGPLPDDLVVRYMGFLKDNERYFEGEQFSYFKNCKIYGSVDYIFGCGESLFESCEMININDGRKVGYVAAPAHSLKQKNGFVFYNCTFSAEKNLDAEIYLARPWRDFGKSLFIDCKCNEHISKIGFDHWNDTERDKTARFEYYNTNIIQPVSWSKNMSEASAKAILDCVFKKANLL